MNQICAAIDIGTNSVLLTIAERQDAGWNVLVEDAHITRLGQGLGEGRSFLQESMERTLVVLERYQQLCQEHNAQRIHVVGTAACRKADNCADFAEQLQQRTGWTLDVISGEREAELAYQSARQDFGEDILVLDIGGGSTEFIWPGSEGLNRISFPMGSVVLKERYLQSDPIAADEYGPLVLFIDQSYQLGLFNPGATHQPLTPSHKPTRMVALAGTVTTLVSMQLELTEYDHDRVHGAELSRQQINTLLQQMLSLPLAARQQLPGLEPARADVIPVGTTLLQQAMELLGYDRVLVSDRGVRWGLLYEC